MSKLNGQINVALKLRIFPGFLTFISVIHKILTNSLQFKSNQKIKTLEVGQLLIEKNQRLKILMN